MALSFQVDPYPGRPRILFVGFPASTHTHSWIGLLDGSRLNVRLFALPVGIPPDNWMVKTYVTAGTSSRLDPATRASLYGTGWVRRWSKKGLARLVLGDVTSLEGRWLAQVVRRWRPDVVHTLGLEPASYFYQEIREEYGLQDIGKWVVQVRGGPDLALHRLVPDHALRIQRVLSECDQMIADNQQNYEYARELGLRQEQLSPLGVVPGTGGVDVERLAQSWDGLPSKRQRLVVWPKAYECPQSKALPVFEALKLAWDRIQPCQVHMLAITPETRMWFHTFPEDLRRACSVADRVPRDEVLQLMAQARVMLAPSLADGVPNALYEAMATGAFPIVSPLDTIQSVVVNERNVLFARNLYPQEIADVLRRAMSDADLVDRAAERNLGLVRRVADISGIRTRVVDYYETLAKE